MSLSERHLQELRDGSAIPLDVINERGYRTVDDPAELIACGFPDWQACHVPALLIPLCGVDGSNGRYAIKSVSPRIGKKDGKPRKYDWPAGSDPMLDVHPRNVAALDDATIPLLFTEGSKKVDCLAGLGYCAINVWGVHSWAEQTDKKNRLFETLRALPDWEPILPTLDGRECYLCFDSDAFRKPSVGLALRRLASFLSRHGALVHIVHLPDAQDGSKQGVDDLVASQGAKAFDQLVEGAEPWGSNGMVLKLQAEIRQLKDERSAIFEVLHNDKLNASERVVAVTVVCSANSRLSRGQGAPLRVTIDAPKNPDNPLDTERVGLAADVGLGKNTVGRALDVVCGENAPLVKKTVYEHNKQGELRAHVELTPTCSGGVPGMLWALARYDPQKPKQHGGPREALTCPEHPYAKVRVRHTAACTVCGQVVEERMTTAPRPEHQVGASVVEDPEDVGDHPHYVLNPTKLVLWPDDEPWEDSYQQCTECGYKLEPDEFLTGVCSECAEVLVT